LSGDYAGKSASVSFPVKQRAARPADGKSQLIKKQKTDKKNTQFSKERKPSKQAEDSFSLWFFNYVLVSVFLHIKLASIKLINMPLRK
jgi:hypothetical protein